MIVSVDPVVVSLPGALAVRWHGLLALVGLGVAVWLSLRALRQAADTLAWRQALAALAWALPAGILVGRLVHVLGWWDYYLMHAGEAWQLNVGGLSLWGALLGGLAIGSARLSRDPPRRRRILDAVAPNLALGIAIGRLGEFLEGAGQGLPSDLPWATQYASRLAATPDFGVARHPAQVYDGLLALALFAALSRWPRRLPAGTRIATFFVLYGSARLALGGVRLDPAFLFGLQIEQILALGGIAWGLAYGLGPLLAWRRGAPAAATAPARPTEDTLAA